MILSLTIELTQGSIEQNQLKNLFQVTNLIFNNVSKRPLTQILVHTHHRLYSSQIRDLQKIDIFKQQEIDHH